MLLAKGAVENASTQFKFCLDRHGESIPVQLGQACVFFYAQNYRMALTLFQKLLIKLPINDIRLAIGYCFYHLGHYKLAIAAFERVLRIDPKCEDALIACGYCYIAIR